MKKTRRDPKTITASSPAGQDSATWCLLLACLCSLGVAACDVSSIVHKTDYNALYCVQACQAVNDCGLLRVAQGDCVERCYSYFSALTPFAAVGLRTCLVNSACNPSTSQACDPKGIVLGGGRDADVAIDPDSSSQSMPGNDDADF